MLIYVIIAIVALMVGYMISDYQSYSNMKDITDKQNAIISGKGWGLFQYKAGSKTTTATI